MVAKASKKPLVLSYLRFSSPEQAKGDSQRRQIAASEKWAAERGLVVDQTLRDQGVSGFSGANVSDAAALGRLLELVKRGGVPAETILLVENLDRLSRQDILEALNIFTTLIRAGLKIVSLADGKEYDKASVTANPLDLMMSIMILSRGHEESRIKSYRVSAAWREKQRNAKNKPVTDICPQWLKPTENGFEVIPEAERAIKAAAEMILNGFTWKQIVSELRAKHPKTYGRKREWSKPIIFEILTSPQLVGIYQPRKRVDSKNRNRSEDIGEAIPDYYPQLLDAKSFRLVQKKIESRRNGGGSRGSETVNIWGGRMLDIAEHKVHISDHGSGKRYKSAGRISGTSDMPMTPMYEVDRGLLMGLIDHLAVREVKISDSPEPLYDELTQVEGRLVKMTATLADMKSDPAIVVEAIDRLQTQKAALLDRIAAAETPTDQSSIVATLKLATGDLTDNENRRRLAVAIAAVVEKVHVHFVIDWRDHVVSAVFHLIDGSEVDCAFRICFESRGVYSLEWKV